MVSKQDEQAQAYSDNASCTFSTLGNEDYKTGIAGSETKSGLGPNYLEQWSFIYMRVFSKGLWLLMPSFSMW